MPDLHRSGINMRYSLEATGKGIEEVVRAQAVIPRGTPINIAFLGNESHAQRVHAARVIRACGAEPVPIISARRLHSEADRDALLQALISEAAPKRFMLVGGDPSTPAGPYRDALSLLASGVLERHGIGNITITGYPEGHPKIDAGELMRALRWKLDFLRQAGCSVEITTQLGFDADATLRWIDGLRQQGIETPIRIGIPGPTDVGKLLRFARQFGVATSAALLHRYGLSVGNLLQRVGAERYWDYLQSGLSEGRLGEVAWHLYPFGGVEEGVHWINQRLNHNAAQPPRPVS